MILRSIVGSPEGGARRRCQIVPGLSDVVRCDGSFALPSASRSRHERRNACRCRSGEFGSSYTAVAPSARNVSSSASFTNQRNDGTFLDRKSTRLNSSHITISYAVFCLKQKKKKKKHIKKKKKKKTQINNK